jgi:hypothetical protein
MKKVESVLDGSPGWGKARTFATFIQIHFCLLSFILPKVFTIQGEGRDASAFHPHVESLFKRLIHLNLTLPSICHGGEMIKKPIYVMMLLTLGYLLYPVNVLELKLEKVFEIGQKKFFERKKGTGKAKKKLLT